MLCTLVGRERLEAEPLLWQSDRRVLAPNRIVQSSRHEHARALRLIFMYLLNAHIAASLKPAEGLVLHAVRIVMSQLGLRDRVIATGHLRHLIELIDRRTALSAVHTDSSNLDVDWLGAAVFSLVARRQVRLAIERRRLLARPVLPGLP